MLPLLLLLRRQPGKKFLHKSETKKTGRNAGKEEKEVEGREHVAQTNQVDFLRQSETNCAGREEERAQVEGNRSFTEGELTGFACALLLEMEYSRQSETNKTGMDVEKERQK